MNFFSLYYVKSLSLFFSLAFLLSCQNSSSQQEVHNWMTSQGKVKTLSTTGMINDLVKRIGGTHVETLTLIKGELDPHSYQLVKGDDEKLLNADLIFYNGLGLEHGPSLQHHLRDSSKAYALGDLVRQENPDLILSVNGQPDPHIWMDISLWERIVPFIVQALSKQDPEHSADYQANGEKLIQEMEQEHKQIKELLQSIPEKQRYLVTSHDAFNYFARQYLATPEETSIEHWQKRFQAPEGLAPESQLSSSDIQYIIDHVAKYHITVLFPESNINKDSIKKIVQAGKEKGLHLKIAPESLFSDAMGAPGSDGDTYLKMMHHNATIIARNLLENASS